MTITPIETVYNGYRFRSRLEARWAVFFDSLGVKYEYEPEGFNIPGVGNYLPDFRVMCYAKRGHDCEPFPLYVEVKGHMDEISAKKIKAFSIFRNTIWEWCDERTMAEYKAWYVKAAKYGRPLLIVGDIPNVQCVEDITDYEVIGSLDELGFDLYPFNYATVEGALSSAFPCVKNGKFGLLGWHNSLAQWGDALHTLYAYKAARQARFEHGETPRLVPMNSRKELIANRALKLFTL